jgi:predicted membrane protein
MQYKSAVKKFQKISNQLSPWMILYMIFITLYLIYSIVAGVGNALFWHNEKLRTFNDLCFGIANLLIAVSTYIMYTKVYIPSKKRLAKSYRKMRVQYEELNEQHDTLNEEFSRHGLPKIPLIPPPSDYSTDRWFGALYWIGITVNLYVGLNSLHFFDWIRSHF